VRVLEPRFVNKLDVKNLTHVDPHNLESCLGESLTEAGSLTAHEWAEGHCISLFATRRQVERVCAVKALRSKLFRFLPLVRVPVEARDVDMDDITSLDMVLADRGISFECELC